MSHDIERRGMLQGLTAGIVASALPGRVAAQSPTVLETREIRGDDGTPLNLGSTLFAPRFPKIY